MGFFNFNKKANYNHTEERLGGAFTPLINEDDFAERMLHNALSKIINDAVLPIEITDDADRPLIEIGAEFIDLTTEEIFEKNNIFRQSKTLREIVVMSLYQEVIIYKVEIGGKNYFFVNSGVTQNQKKLRIGDRSYDIKKAYAIDKPLHDKYLLMAPFKLLYNYYVQIDLYNQKSNMIFFKKNNFNKMMDGIAEPENYDLLIDLAKKTYNDFFKGKGGVIDALDSFETLTMNVADLVNAIDFAYKEISRLLGIPQSELLGESPTGLSSAGVVSYQENTYEKRLEDYRKRIIIPILKGLEVAYTESGMTLEEKLAIAYEFSVNLPNLSVDNRLYVEAKALVLELMGVDYDKEADFNELESNTKNTLSSPESAEFDEFGNNELPPIIKGSNEPF